MNSTHPPYSVAEEWLNSLSHGIGFLLSILGLVAMIVVASKYSSAQSITAVSIYGASLILLFLASTLYHSFQSKNLKKKLKILDHCAIYLLIAGTYTPYMLISLKGAWGYSMVSIIWSLALVGIVFKLFFTEKFPKVSLITYLLMGWLIVIASPVMVDKISSGGLVYLVAGGVIYSLGTLFYAIKQIPFNHAIWHFFVLAGASSHFISIYCYVLPRSVTLL